MKQNICCGVAGKLKIEEVEVPDNIYGKGYSISFSMEADIPGMIPSKEEYNLNAIVKYSIDEAMIRKKDNKLFDFFDNISKLVMSAGVKNEKYVRIFEYPGEWTDKGENG